MKRLFFIVMLLIPLPGLADIYKCKDARQVVVYQDEPCTTRMLGMVKPVPAPSEKDVLQARRDLELMIQNSRYYEQQRREEWAREQEERRLLEAQEMRERLAAKAYQDESRLYIPAYGWGYGHKPFAHHHRHRHPELIMPSQKRPFDRLHRR